MKIFACSLLVALCAQVAFPLPWTPVPVTLQTLGVLLTGVLLSPLGAGSAVALYLAYGAAGLPLFAPTGPGGLAALAGPSGGYLMSFPAAAALTSWLYRRWRGKGHFVAVGGAGLISIAAVYLCGGLWLAVLTGRPWDAILVMAVYPFVAADLMKIAAAAWISRYLVSGR